MNTSLQKVDRMSTFLTRGTKFFIIGSGTLFIVYIYFIGAVTFTVLHQRSIEEDQKTLTSTISEQELSYLSDEKNLTMEYANSIGLVSPSMVAYTSAKQSVAFNAR